MAQALADSQQQLAEIIARWGKAMTVERFFVDAEERLSTTDDEDRRKRLEERLARARAMMESVDPLDFIESWLAPQERYQAKFAQTRYHAAGGANAQRSEDEDRQTDGPAGAA